MAANDKEKRQEKRSEKGVKATITHVDSKNGTVTVKFHGRKGKEGEKTFKLTEDVRMLDSRGDVVAIDVFKSGHDVLVVEREGKLRELHQAKHDKNAKERRATDKDNKSKDNKSSEK